MNSPRLIQNIYFIAAALFISCCFVSGCENDDKVIKELTENKVLVEEISKIEGFFSEDGKMKSKLTAPLMLRVPGRDTQYIEFPKSLHADFYDDSARLESWLDAKYGKYLQNYSKVYLRDSVVVISLKGDTLRTKELWWDQNRQLFYTDSVATFHSPGNNIIGVKGMEATQDFNIITFKQPLATMKVSETGFAE